MQANAGLQVQRAKRQGSSPTMVVSQTKKSAYKGYMHLQSLALQQNQASSGSSVPQQQQTERSLESSRGIAGVSLNPTQPKLVRVSQVNKEMRTQRKPTISINLLDNLGYVLPDSSIQETNTSESRQGFQRKISKANIQTSPRPQEGVANIQDIIKMLKQNERSRKKNEESSSIKGQRKLVSSQGRLIFDISDRLGTLSVERKRQGSKTGMDIIQQQIAHSPLPPAKAASSLIQKNIGSSLSRRNHDTKEGSKSQERQSEATKPTMPGHFILVPQQSQVSVSLRRRTSSSIKREAIRGSMSAHNLHESAGSIDASQKIHDSMLSATQRSINIYRNALSRGRKKEIVVVSQGKRQSPKGHVGRELLKINPEPVQFFNCSQSGLGTSTLRHPRGSSQLNYQGDLKHQITSTRFYQNFKTRKIFQLWQQNARMEAFKSNRASLLSSFSFKASGFKNVYARTQAHFKALIALRPLQEESCFTTPYALEKIVLTIKSSISKIKSLGSELPEMRPSLEKLLASASQQFILNHTIPNKKILIQVLDQSHYSVEQETVQKMVMDIVGAVSRSFEQVDTVQPLLYTMKQAAASDLKALELCIYQIASAEVRSLCFAATQLHTSVSQELQRKKEESTLGHRDAHVHHIQHQTQDRHPNQVLQNMEALTSKLQREEHMPIVEEWQLLGQHLQRLDELLFENRELNMITIDASEFKGSLSRVFCKRMEGLRAELVSSLESDTSSLRKDLSKASETLTQPIHQGHSKSANGPLISLPAYIEQLNVVKALSTPQMRDQLFGERLAQIKQLALILEQMPASQASQVILQNIEDIESILLRLPQLIDECKRKLEKQKQLVELQLYQGLASLSQKISTFQAKYIDRYLDSWEQKVRVIEKADGHQMLSHCTPSSRMQSALILDEMLQEVVGRGKTVSEIESKCNLYRECLGIIDAPSFKRDEVIMNSPRVLHDSVLLLWRTYREVKVDFDTSQKPFLSMAISQVLKRIKEQEEQIKNISFDGGAVMEEFKSFLYQKIRDIQGQLEPLERLQAKQLADQSKALLQSRHWKLIFHGKKSAMNLQEFKDDFSFTDVQKINPSILESVMAMAIAEDRSQLLVKRAKTTLTSIIPIVNRGFFKSLIDESSGVLERLEELIVELERECMVTSHCDLKVKEELEELFHQSSDVSDALKDMLEVQKVLVQQKAFFTYSPMKEVLQTEFQSFTSLQEKFDTEIIDHVRTLPITELIKSQTWKRSLEVVADELILLQKSTESYFEERRLSFPRLFFLTDLQCLELLSLAEQAKDFNHLFSQIFPGAHSVLNDGPFSEQLEHTIAPFVHREPHIKNIVGLVSSHKDLLLLEKPVPFRPDDVPLTLQNLELSMQQTIGSLIAQAVSSFPKQSLDEWILDYPLQTILTTIHLILTHEINELFDDTDSHHDRFASQDERQMATLKPDTRDLVVATASSQPETKRFGHQRTISVQHLQKEYAQRPTHQRVKSCQQLARVHLGYEEEIPYPQSKESLEDQEEWAIFKKDMFGSEFDLNDEQNKLRRLQIGVTDEKDVIMRVLQEKSFSGLYLRLQFWINQICKTLKIQSEDQLFRHSKEQKRAMESIVNFLSYMKDVVLELKVKQISSIEDFDWQKQVRLTWQGNQGDETKGCRVDCGAWQTYQANEYIGNHIVRLPLTPLTNKYFVFISAALREKSAVLLRCMPTHDYSGDVFQEFANICTTPMKQFHCLSPNVTMKSLMQFMNGAALASTWIFFEHVDKLDYLHLQTFNKEIQMVQQQFIIAELSQGSEEGPRFDEVVPEGLSTKQEDSLLLHGSRISSVGGFKSSQKQRKVPQVLMQSVMNPALRETSASRRRGEQEEEKRSVRQLPPQRNSSRYQSQRMSGQSKVCFGVFASLSHQFGMLHEQWAAEISSSLQSAFRVLSMTRPELSLITAMLLKSKGFKHYEELSSKLHQALNHVREEVLRDLIKDRDDWFCLTSRDIKYMVQACSSIKSSIEDEFHAVAKALSLFLMERIQSYSSFNSLSMTSLRDGVRQVVQKAFSLTITLNEQIQDQLDVQVTLEKEHGLVCDYSLAEKMSYILQCLRQRRPLMLVGGPRTGKQTLVETAAKILARRPLYLNPDNIGTFRELYGSSDQVSISSSLVQNQLGEVKYALISSILDQADILVLEGAQLSNPFFECLIPYLESRSFQLEEQKVIRFPNGLVKHLKNDITLLFKTRSLQHSTPRLITSLALVNFQRPFAEDLDTLVSVTGARLKKRLGIKLSAKIIADILAPFMKNSKYPIDRIGTILDVMSTCSPSIRSSESQLHQLFFFSVYMAFGLAAENKSALELNVKRIKDRYMAQPSQLFDMIYDSESKIFKDTSLALTVDGGIVVSNEFRRARHLFQASTQHNFLINGDKGAGKRTLMRYLTNESQTLHIPQMRLLSFKSLRQLLIKAPCVSKLHIVIEDCSLKGPDSINFLEILRLNIFKIMTTDSTNMTPVPFDGFITLSSLKEDEEAKNSTVFNLANEALSIPSLFKQTLNLLINDEKPVTHLMMSSSQSWSEIISNLHVLRVAKQIEEEVGPVLQVQQTNHLFSLKCGSRMMDSEIFKRSKLGLLLQLRIDQVSEEELTSFISDVDSAIHVRVEKFKDYGNLLLQLIEGSRVPNRVFIIDEDVFEDPMNFEILNTIGMIVDNEPSSKSLIEMLASHYPELSPSSLKGSRFIIISRSKVPKSYLTDRLLHVDLRTREQSVLPNKLAEAYALVETVLRCHGLNVQERKKDFMSIQSKAYSITRDSLSKNVEFKRKVAATCKEFASSNQGTKPTKAQLMQYQMVYVQERLDHITTQVKSIDNSLKLVVRETNDLRHKYQTMLKDAQESMRLDASMNKLLNHGEQAFKNFKRSTDLLSVKAILAQMVATKSIFELSLEDFIAKLKTASMSETQKKALKEFMTFKFDADSFNSDLQSILADLSSGQRVNASKQFSRMANQLRENISYNESALLLQRHQLAVLNDEAQTLLEQEKSFQNGSDASKEVKESVRSAKNDYLFKAAIKEMTSSSEQELIKLKIREKNLNGDSILIASSFTLLNSFPLEQRMKLRAEIKEILLKKLSIHSSESWSSVQSEQVHCKQFKKFLTQSLGIRLQIDGHGVVDSILAEYLAFQVLSSGPIATIDSSGFHTGYLTQKVLNKAFSMIHTSELQSSKQLQSQLSSQEDDRAVIISGIHPLDRENQGKCYPIRTLETEDGLQRIRDLRIKGLFSKNLEVSIPQVQIHVEYLRHLTPSLQYNAIDMSFVNRTEVWIEIKQMLLKHFLPETYQKINDTISQQTHLKEEIKQKRSELETECLNLTRDPSNAEVVRQIYQQLARMEANLKHLNQTFHALINEHPLLASYSNIFVIVSFLSNTLDVLVPQSPREDDSRDYLFLAHVHQGA